MEYPSDNVIPFPGGPRLRTGTPTFAELAEDWMRSEGVRLVEPENERRHIGHLKPLWILTEEQLRPGKVKEVLAALLKPTGHLGAATVNKVRSTGRRIIREAQINDRWLGPNPFEIVRRYRQTRPKHRTLSLEEVRRLLPYLREDRRREALVMLYLGTRPGEWKALRREDLDFNSGWMVVRRSNGRDQTKTGKERRVPITDGLRPVLEEAMAEAPASSPLVFPNSKGELQRADVKLSRMLHGALTRAGLVTGFRYSCRRKGCGHQEERREKEQLRCPKCSMKLWVNGIPLPVRFYDLRHSAATLHRMAGCDPLVIQLVLGHAAENLTDSVYTHLSDDYVREQLNKLKL